MDPEWRSWIGAVLVGALIGAGVIALVDVGTPRGNLAEWLQALGTVGALWATFGLWRNELGKRAAEKAAAQRAAVTIRLEQWHEAGKYQVADRTAFVIENQGPAIAQRVMFGVDGRRRFDDSSLPLSELLPGEQHHVTDFGVYGDDYPVNAWVTWSDGDGEHRRGRILTIQARR